MTSHGRLHQIYTMLEQLTRPSPHLTNAEQRQRARVLSVLAASLLGGCAILFPLWILLLPYYEENRVIALVTTSLIGVVYALSRTRYYIVGAWGLVTSIFFIVVATILTAPGNTIEQMQTLYFLILAIMFAYFFFSRAGVVLTVLLTIGIIAWFFVSRLVPVPLMYAFLVFFVITVLLGGVFSVLNHLYRVQIARSEERYRSVVSVLSEGIVVHDTNGAIIASNAAAADILGLTEDQLHGRDSFDPRWRTIREDGTPFEGQDHPAMVTLRTGQPQHGVVMGVHRPDGRLRWIAITSKPLTTGKGVVVSFEDITERRHAEQTLQQFVNDMRALQHLHLELSEVAELDELQRQMVVLSQQRLGLDRIGLFLLNDEGTCILGTYGTDPAGNLRDEHYYSEPITPDHWTLPLTQSPDHAQLQENVTLYDNGQPVGVGWAAQAALWNGERAIGYLAIDNFVSRRPPRAYELELLSILGSTFGHLIERKRNEMALQASEQRHRALLSAIPDLVLRLNAEGVYIDLHAPESADLVAPRDQIIGRRVEELMPAEVADMAMRALRRVLQTGREEIIEYTLKIDGVNKAYEARMVAAQPDEVLTIVRNVTERERAKQREFDLSLAKERVRLMQQFIGKASHEFRTPMAIINSSAYLMARTEDPERREQRAATIQQQVNRLAKMIDTLFLLSRLESGIELSLAPLDIGVTVRSVCQAMSEAHQDTPPLKLTVEEGLANVTADAKYLQEAFMQILDNAYRFTPPDGVIYVDVSCVNGEVQIEIRDTGVGIAPEHLPFVFDVFWQQNPTDSSPGLGIGLSIARRIVEMHGGKIAVQSAPDSGAVFKVILPLTTAPVISAG